MISDKTANFVIYVTTFGWILSLLAGIFGWGDYQPSEAINGVFTAIISAFIAAKSIGHRGGKK